MPGSPAKFFLDTNIFVYTFDEISSVKRARARELVELALTTRLAVVSAALEAGCRILYSQDLQHGRQFGSLTLVDPFAG